MRISLKSPTSILASLALALAISGLAVAQDNPPPDRMGKMGAMHSDMQGMQGMRGNVMGMHKMPATVTSADAKTGIVHVTSAGMELTLHFPPPTMAELKAGDKITLHLGYTKP
ncbi:hypothetical protein [Dokdonella sp.]|uniref:hypothetical protein n=1 Tax=Dokdonella sp. TaxID=2291710 RepID=UPI0031C579B7|nr:hypothetical protein [Dokdonella sp.]